MDFEAHLKRNDRLPAILACLWVAVLPSRSAAQGQAESVWGPAFGSRGLYALHVPIFGFGPVATRALAPGESEWTLESAYANTFTHSWHAISYHVALGPPRTPFRADEAARIHHEYPEEPAWFVDAEVLRSAVTGRVGVGASLFLSAEIPWISHDAFTADRLIITFHRAVGLGQAGRTDFPTGQFVAMLQPPNGAMRFDNRLPEPGLGDVSASVSWRPAPLSRGVTFGVDLAVKAPTGAASDYNGSGSWDAGALVFLARPGRLWNFEAQAGVVIPGRWKGTASLPTSPFGRIFLAATRRLGPRTRAGASVTYEQSPFREERLGELSKAGMDVAFGLERDFAREVAVRLTVTEHISDLGDRADVGAALAIRYRPSR